MTALRNLASGPHPQIALEAFIRFQNFVVTGLLSEKEAMSITARSTNCAGVPISEVEQTIARAFAAARKEKTTMRGIETAFWGTLGKTPSSYRGQQHTSPRTRDTREVRRGAQLDHARASSKGHLHRSGEG